MNELDMEFLISRYADNTLSEPERQRARQLLESDPACRQWLSHHRQIQELLSDWASRVPMLDWKTFDARLETRLDQHLAAQARHVVHLRRWLAVSAAAGIILLVGITLWLPHLAARKDIPSVRQPVSVAAAPHVIGPAIRPMAIAKQPAGAITRPATIGAARIPQAVPSAKVIKTDVAQASKPGKKILSHNDLGVAIRPAHLPAHRGVADSAMDRAAHHASHATWPRSPSSALHP